jgi:hypothetical protein
MEQKKQDWRWLRVVGALLIGLLILAVILPSTGGIIAGPPHNGMWRCGPFLFFPAAFAYIGIVTVSATCTVFGIVRRNKCEAVGWVLLGLMFVIFALG